jgi:hypothetical protein
MLGYIGRHTGRVVLFGVLLFAVLGGIAYATIPDSNGVYTACRLNGVGTIRLIDPSLPSTNLQSHCTSLETQIQWNQQGQRGLQGPPGDTGPPGPPGAAGGAVLTGRMNGLSTTLGHVDFGAPSGTSSASDDQHNVEMISPNHDLKARDFSVRLTEGGPGPGANREVDFRVNATTYPLCFQVLTEGEFTCAPSTVIDVPAGSLMSIVEFAGGSASPQPTDLQFAFRLTDS